MQIDTVIISFILLFANIVFAFFLRNSVVSRQQDTINKLARSQDGFIDTINDLRLEMGKMKSRFDAEIRALKGEIISYEIQIQALKGQFNQK